MAAVTDGGAVTRFRERLRGSAFGDVRVADVTVDARLDSEGDEYTVVTLVLDPPAGANTWKLDDVYDLRAEARRVAAEEGMGLVSFIVTSSGDAGTSDEGRDDVMDLDEALRRAQGDGV